MKHGLLRGGESDNDNNAQFTTELARRDLFGRLALLRESIDGAMVFTTSFGIEDQAIAHAIFAQALQIDVVTLDTGRLFPETYDVWAQTECRYGISIRAFYPEASALESLVANQRIDGFRQSVEARKTCCGVRKVAPLKRALSGAAAWITGLRADQSGGRAVTSFVAFDNVRRLLKLSPLADWTRAAVVDYIASEAIPHNALHARGFLSIGCAPCTRANRPGEPERAGRWWWEDESSKECGLHVRPERSGTWA